MPPGYRMIIPAETSRIGTHRTVLAETSPDLGNGTVSHFLVSRIIPRERSIKGAGYRLFLPQGTQTRIAPRHVACDFVARPAGAAGETDRARSIDLPDTHSQ